MQNMAKQNYPGSVALYKGQEMRCATTLPSPHRVLNKVYSDCLSQCGREHTMAVVNYTKSNKLTNSGGTKSFHCERNVKFPYSIHCV